jgi:hypothetical protein
LYDVVSADCAWPGAAASTTAAAIADNIRPDDFNIRPDDFNEFIALFPPLPAERIRAIRYADVLPLRRLSWLLAYLLERDRRVATFAGPPECATMGVVLAVAGIAIRGQRDLGDILGNVAGLAVETAVRPG